MSDEKPKATFWTYSGCYLVVVAIGLFVAVGYLTESCL